ncbi:heterokaryon incompatibility protein-domain-containing protein [Leptodontidium sp. 2 PMI_412]|nr:heterokaryon incompatibility protein-domain-containing protein [Leptodontidium sp. 2 PMI_412]
MVGLLVECMKPKESLGTTWHFPHCWGPPELIFKTTVQAFGNNKTELPWGKLSRTLREAIEVTRRLGIRYIWIDSLCVLQVDEDDWNREAANMGNIYKNAYLTLAATASSSEIPLPKEQNLELATLKARRSRLHFSLEVLESGDSFVHRGWAYQERLLARQIVHFTSEEMVWECKPQQTRECSSPSGLQEGRSEFESLLEGGRKSWWSWQMLLTRYTTLQLSKEEDRLPAISGIATSCTAKGENRFRQVSSGYLIASGVVLAATFISLAQRRMNTTAAHQFIPIWTASGTQEYLTMARGSCVWIVRLSKIRIWSHNQCPCKEDIDLTEDEQDGEFSNDSQIIYGMINDTWKFMLVLWRVQSEEECRESHASPATALQWLASIVVGQTNESIGCYPLLRNMLLLRQLVHERVLANMHFTPSDVFCGKNPPAQ